MREDRENLIAAVHGDGEDRKPETADCDNGEPGPTVNFLTTATSTINSTTVAATTHNNNNLRVLSRKRSFSINLGGVPTWTKRLSQIWRFHWKVLAVSLLTVLSATGSIVTFPVYLRSMTNPDREGLGLQLELETQGAGEGAGEGVDGTQERGDGYSACLAITTTTTLLMGVLAAGLKWAHYTTGRTVIRPMIPCTSVLKIGFCNGLCILTMFYAWEDHKVLCNLQDPLLGLVFLFAIVTHSVSKWPEIGFRRAFSFVTICAGIFISVDYTVVDHQKCRGYYFYPVPVAMKDPWSWQVHLVWTLAFVVSIWLWTIAMFCVESSLPNLKEKRHHVGEQYNAVKMKVIRVKRSGQLPPSSAADVTSSDPLNSPDVVATAAAAADDAANGGSHEPEMFQRPTIRQLRTVYSRIPYLRVFNATLWFHISTWMIIASLFWTQLIPGFGKGITIGELPRVLGTGFRLCWTSLSSWLLMGCVILFSQSFTYLLLLIRSPLISIGVACLAFPLVSVFWSFFQFNHNVLIWTPMVSGELFCGFLGIPLIMGGLYYLFKLDVLKLDFKAASASSAVMRPSPAQIV